MAVRHQSRETPTEGPGGQGVTVSDPVSVSMDCVASANDATSPPIPLFVQPRPREACTPVHPRVSIRAVQCRFIGRFTHGIDFIPSSGHLRKREGQGSNPLSSTTVTVTPTAVTRGDAIARRCIARAACLTASRAGFPSRLSSSIRHRRARLDHRPQLMPVDEFGDGRPLLPTSCRKPQIRGPL